MERPIVNNRFPDLAGYQLTIMSNAYARQENGNVVTFDAPNNQQILMYNGNDYFLGHTHTTAAQYCSNGTAFTECLKRNWPGLFPASSGLRLCPFSTDWSL